MAAVEDFDRLSAMIKLKSNQTRTYDRDGYKKRAACLCFRSEREEEVTPAITATFIHFKLTHTSANTLSNVCR